MHEFDDGGTLRHIHAIVITLDFRINPSRVSLAVDFERMARRGFFETMLHVFGLTVELFRAVASSLAAQHYLVGHDIDRHAALDHANIRSGLMIDASQAHVRNPIGGDSDRVDASLRTYAGMRFEPVHTKFQPV